MCHSSGYHSTRSTNFNIKSPTEECIIAYFQFEMLPLLSLPLLQLRKNWLSQGLRPRSARPPADHFALLVDQELFKVPFYSLDPQYAWLLIFHPLVHGLCLVTVDICLAEYGESHAVVDLAEVLDLII